MLLFVCRYCVGKCLITYPLVIKESGQVEPLVGLNAATSAQPRSPPRPPKDLNKVVGVRLPAAVYLLLAEGLLSKQLVSALAQGEWLDSLQPSVESAELRDLFYEIVHYRCRALGRQQKPGSPASSLSERETKPFYP